MFQYYSRIDARFNLPVYPIAVFSYDRPLVPAANVHTANTFGLQVIRFEFHPIQLNTPDWRTFCEHPIRWPAR